MGKAGEAPQPVLVVDDDLEMRRVLADFLRAEGFRVDQAGDAEEAMRRVGDTRYASVILDNHLPGESGLGILPRLRSLAPGIPVILVTTIGDERLHELAFARGAYDLLLKPFSLDDLVEVLRSAAEHAASGT
ncbi:MAG: response regulator, partial [Gemmatimonadales bacterium]